jgi:hypothetical protein
MEEITGSRIYHSSDKERNDILGHNVSTLMIRYPLFSTKTILPKASQVVSIIRRKYYQTCSSLICLRGDFFWRRLLSRYKQFLPLGLYPQLLVRRSELTASRLTWTASYLHCQIPQSILILILHIRHTVACLSH